MTGRPTLPLLAHLADDELERLALQWRAQASRGDREAFGIAHAFEVEVRRRQRASQMQALPPEPAPDPRRWWQFWRPAGPDPKFPQWHS